MGAELRMGASSELPNEMISFSWKKKNKKKIYSPGLGFCVNLLFICSIG